VHLDDDNLDDNNLAYLKLPTDEAAAESVAEQRALMVSFETQRHDGAARRLMTIERRAAADRLATMQQRARHSGHRCNTAAAVEARVAVGWRLQEKEQVRAAALRGRASTTTPSRPTPTPAS
jgi:hypothetical protein